MLLSLQMVKISQPKDMKLKCSHGLMSLALCGKMQFVISVISHNAYTIFPMTVHITEIMHWELMENKPYLGVGILMILDLSQILLYSGTVVSTVAQLLALLPHSKTALGLNPSCSLCAYGGFPPSKKQSSRCPWPSLDLELLLLQDGLMQQSSFTTFSCVKWIESIESPLICVTKLKYPMD